MGCACNSGQKKPQSYVHTSPSGKQTVYRSKVEADAARISQGGSVKPQG